MSRISSAIEETCQHYLAHQRPELLAEAFAIVQCELFEMSRAKKAAGETICDKVAEAIRVSRNVCLCLLHEATIRKTVKFALSPNHPSLDDIVNTCLYKLLKAAEAKEEAGEKITNWQAYAKKVTTNEVIDLRRKSTDNCERSADEPDVPTLSDDGRAARTMEDAVDHVITDELELRVVVFDLLYQYFAGPAVRKTKEMDATGKRRLKVYYYRVWEDMPQNEIARLLEVSDSTLTRDCQRLKTLAENLFTAFDAFVRSLSLEDRQVVRLGRRLRSVQEIAELMEMPVNAIMRKVENVRCAPVLVEKLQIRLRDAGYDIAVDGWFGPLTAAAFNQYENWLENEG